MRLERSPGIRRRICHAASEYMETITAMKIFIGEDVAALKEKTAKFSPKKAAKFALKPAGILFAKATDLLIVNCVTLKVIEWTSERGSASKRRKEREKFHQK